MWNLDSGAVRRKLIIAGHARKPENEQAVEKITFMHGDVGYVALQTGRWWELPPSNIKVTLPAPCI